MLATEYTEITEIKDYVAPKQGLTLSEFVKRIDLLVFSVNSVPSVAKSFL